MGGWVPCALTLTPLVIALVLMIISIWWRGLYQMHSTALNPMPPRMAIEHGTILVVFEGGAVGAPAGTSTLGVLHVSGWYWHRMNPDYALRMMWCMPEIFQNHYRLPLWTVAAVSGLVMVGLIAVRWARRRRVERPCGRCAYSLKGLGASGVCPECGEAFGERGADSTRPVGGG